LAEATTTLNPRRLSRSLSRIWRWYRCVATHALTITFALRQTHTHPF